jgi:hypothetical protein
VSTGGVYLQSKAGHVFGVVGCAAVDGPLGLRVQPLHPFGVLPGVLNGTPFRFSREHLLIGERAVVDFGGASPWAQRTPVVQGDTESRRRSARALLTAVSRNPRGPVSWLLAGEPGVGSVGKGIARRVCTLAGEFVDALRIRDLPASRRALLGLLGLGSGLTPSGDDLVAGVVAAAAWMAPHSPLAAAINEETRRWLVAAAAGKTNRIGARLLHHAALGVLYAPAMRLGRALLAGEPEGVERAAPDLLAIGGSSGAETAAGVLLGAVFLDVNEGKEVPVEELPQQIGETLNAGKPRNRGGQR